MAYPTINITAPSGNVSWAKATGQKVSWTLSSPVSVGGFGIWVISQRDNIWTSLGTLRAVAGKTVYSQPVSLSAIPLGAYKVTVWYRVDTNKPDYQVSDLEDGIVTVVTTVPSPPPTPTPVDYGPTLATMASKLTAIEAKNVTQDALITALRTEVNALKVKVGS